MNRFFYSLFISLIILPTALFSWFDGGHRVVARIAYDRLEPKVKEDVNRYLQAATSPFPAFQTFEASATLPDHLKEWGLHAFDTWHYTLKVYDPSSFLSSRERVYFEKSLKKRDVLFAIESATFTLGDKGATDFAKGWMLFFLIHTVGDIHQPMHVCSFYSADFPKGDRGGNKFPLVFRGETTNLHSFFDGMCGLCNQRLTLPLSLSDEALLNHVKERAIANFPEECQKSTLLDPRAWLEESYLLSVNYRQNLKSNEALSEDQIRSGEQICTERVALAGYRLAHLLNNLLR